MRLIAGTLLSLALVACASPATTEAPPVAPPSRAPAATPTPSRSAQLLALAGHINAPTRGDIERLFGPADITRQDGAGVALTYRLNTCALLLIFTADAHNAMRLADAHPSARQGGQSLPTLDQCASEAEARRS